MKIRTMALMLLLVSILLVPQMNAQCTNATLSGTYAFRVAGFDFFGFTTANLNFFNIYTEVGQFTITSTNLGPSGQGTFNIKDSISANAVVQRYENHAGYYQVNPDCSGSLTVHGTSIPVYNYDFYITGGGSGMYLIATDQGSGASGVATKQ